ncbi:ATP-binding protein [Motiliproteus sp. MSK22-1]|uniref:sensor histidine kinase n=1 Tax=Motiliproteus sp. MSK22-1 TaxID=1897630 RepID=UPI0009773543|nr:ATP-binding protein [Motiliproteus sp. MSK22-1]OMH31658.1 hypothetical protein BGP75_16130 [Motiliproteus sp. MSK22-1]
MTTVLSKLKLPLFPVILFLTLTSFLAAAAIQLWSTSKIAEQTIDNEIRNLTKQTHTSLQLFFDNQLGRAELLIGHFASDMPLTESVFNLQRLDAADNLDRLYNSRTGSNLELLFLMLDDNQVWVDASSPFFSNLEALEALHLNRFSFGRWYLFELPVANEPQIIALRKEPMIDTESGQVIGSLVGGLVLSGNLQMINEARRYIGLPGIALRYRNNLLAESTDSALGLENHFQKIGGNVVEAFSRQGQFVVGSYFLQLGNELSELEFLTLISSDSFQQLKDSYIAKGLTLTVMILIISLITSYLIIVIAVRPLLKLIGQAKNTIYHGKDMHAEQGLINEYNTLGRTLSQLINSFHRQRASLQVVNDELEDHVDQLKRSNRELDSFAYVASHDLKSPLRGIEQLASWIEEDLGENAPTDTVQHLKLMRSRVDRMERLLDDLLTYSRVGRAKAGLTLVDTGAIVQESFAFLAPPPGFKLLCEGDFPTLNTLRVPFEQVLQNLIGNAIKHHGGEQGLIQVEVVTTDKGYQFTVTDDGPGIDPKHHDRVFGMFQTLRPRDEVEGSGIGLALVEKIVNLYGGEITLSSDGERGTRVRFTWPNEETLRKQLNE